MLLHATVLSGEPQRTIERIPKLDFIEADPTAGIRDAVIQCLDILAETLLALRGFTVQFGFAGGALRGIIFQGFNFGGRSLRLGAANAGTETFLDHLREAAQFEADGLSLAHERAKHSILGTLRVNEVMAENLGVGLEFAVNAAVALLQARGIPGGSKWNRCQQCAQVETFPAASVAMRMRGLESGGSLKARFKSSRLSGGVGP